MTFQKFLDNPQLHAPSPNDVFRAARDNPYLSQCIQAWRNGRCTWEQALAAGVVVMVDHVIDNPMSRKTIPDIVKEERQVPVQ